MTHQNLIHSFDEVIRPVIGMKVSRARNGYGSAIILDLGELHEDSVSKRARLRGEADILIQWDWRAEFEGGVIVGSSSSRQSIQQFLERLEGVQIISAGLDETTPELRIQFSNGVVIRSMVMHRADPQWSVGLPSGKTCQIINGVLTDQRPKQPMTAVEQAESDLSESACKRWKADELADAPNAGRCAHCTFFIHLDASFYFHDFGVCACANSPRDGRVTAAKWTCSRFSPQHDDV